MTTIQSSDTPVLVGGIPTAQPVAGGDWMEKSLNALVQIQTARYAAKFANALSNQHTGGAAVPMDGNPNAPTQQPTAWNDATTRPGLVVSEEMVAYALIAGVIVLAVALD